MFQRHEGTTDCIARLALATVLLPGGLFWLGGLQGNIGGLFAALVGVLGLLTGLTSVSPSYMPSRISLPERDKEQTQSSQTELTTALSGTAKDGAFSHNSNVGYHLGGEHE